MRGSSDGARAELAAFCDAQNPRLVGSLTLYCGDREVARDLAQEAMLRLVRSWPRVREYERPGAWLHRVALHLASSHYRRRQAERRARSRLDTPEGSTCETDRIDADLTVRDVVARLPRRQREVLILRYFAELPTEVVADELGITVGSVRVLTHRAVSRMREELGVGATVRGTTDG